MITFQPWAKEKANGGHCISGAEKNLDFDIMAVFYDIHGAITGCEYRHGIDQTLTLISWLYFMTYMVL